MRYRGQLIIAVAAVLGTGVPTSAQCVEAEKLVAPSGAPEDHLGADVSLGGDAALVGAPGSQSGPSQPGAAFLFRFDGRSWGLEEEFVPSDGQAHDRFGSSVAFRGDIALIGASEDDDRGEQSGSAYVFRRDGSRWIQEQKLLAPDGAPGARFGCSVALDDDALLVGAWQGNAVYVFRHDGECWIEEQKLVPPDRSDTVIFGYSVAMDGNVAVVGGVAIDENYIDIWGAAHVFRFDGASWVHEQELLVAASWASGFFGVPVGVSGEVTIVGAWLDPENGVASGSAYLFRHDGESWAHEQTVYPPDGQTSDVFGFDVAIVDDMALVGARGDDSVGNGAGAAFLFSYDGARWVQVQELHASDGADLDSFGVAVALADGGALIGASAADPFGDDSGAAYIYTCDNSTPCPGDATGDGVVDVRDLLTVLNTFGRTGGSGDVTGDGVVNVLDLLAVLTAWGACA